MAKKKRLENLFLNLKTNKIKNKIIKEEKKKELGFLTNPTGFFRKKYLISLSKPKENNKIKNIFYEAYYTNSIL